MSMPRQPNRRPNRLSQLLARSLLMTALQISGLSHARAPEASSPPPAAEESGYCTHAHA